MVPSIFSIRLMHLAEGNGELGALGKGGVFLIALGAMILCCVAEAAISFLEASSNLRTILET